MIGRFRGSPDWDGDCMTVPEGTHSIDVTHGKGGSHAEIPIDAVDTSRTVLLIDEWIKIFSEWQ